MSIRPYNKSVKTSTPTTSTNNQSRKLKDERPYTNFPQRGPPKKVFCDGKKAQANPRNIRGQQQRIITQKKYEKYAPGSSYVKADGSVKETPKKVSLNHLFNFKFEPRESEDAYAATRPKLKRPYQRKSSVSAFSKERFLQANCQFVVSEEGDYSIHFTDPDAPVPWAKVERVKIKVDDEIFCPICLYPPSVAKITKCGHVFCWPCVLHYLALADKCLNVRECPICSVDVRKSDLRSVTIHESIPLCVGAEVEMKLLFRNAGSLIPHPITEMDNHDCSTVERNIQNLKISMFSLQEVLDLVIEPELKELNCKLAEDLEDLERDFVESAVKECEERKIKVLNDISQKSENCISRATTEAGSVSSEASVHSALPKPYIISEVKTLKENAKADSFHYFYQAENEENVYLNGINVKCLLKEYGSFAKCPMTVKADLVHFESFIMTEELRKRHKYLSHLPLSCEYKIVELDFKTPLISQETLDEFKGHIQHKAKTRRNKERQENASRKRAEYEEQQKMKRFLWEHSSPTTTSAFISNSSLTGSISVLATGNAVNCAANESSYDSVSATSSEYSMSPTSMSYSSSGAMSFAEMLRAGEVGFPKVHPKKYHSQQQKEIATGHENDCQKPQDYDDPEDPYYTPPAYQSSFGDAMSVALERLDISGTGIDVKAENMASKKGGKRQKKKKKQTLLFSTSTQMHP